MSFGRLGDSNEPMSEMNVIPLVDVMLVLLVIFIVTAPVITHSVQLELPRASSTPE
jgi:biopolymer transport protein ExbD